MGLSEVISVLGISSRRITENLETIRLPDQAELDLQPPRFDNRCFLNLFVPSRYPAPPRFD
jgi:hypothetical protein